MESFLRFASVAVLVLTATCFAEPSFVGFMTDGPRTLLAIREEPSLPARWVTIGDRLGSYSVARFDRNLGSVTLRSDERTITLHLPESKVRPTVDLAKIESMAANGHKELARLLYIYRRIEETRNKMKSTLDRPLAPGEEENKYRKRFPEGIKQSDSVLTMVFERMQEEAASKDVHSK